MNGKTIAYWATTGLFGFAMLGSGFMNFSHAPEMVAAVHEHLGFPVWFLTWLGAWKLAGVPVLLAPGLARLKEWAYAGYTVSLTSAAAAHLFTGDPVAQAIAPLVMLGLALASWTLRPDSRRLPGITRDGVSEGLSPAPAK